MTNKQLKKVIKILDKYDIFTIHEKFKFITTYEVDFLKLWCEDGIAGFYDYNDKVFESGNIVLQGFLFSSTDCTLGNDMIRLHFKEGEVTILCS